MTRSLHEYVEIPDKLMLEFKGGIQMKWINKQTQTENMQTGIMQTGKKHVLYGCRKF